MDYGIPKSTIQKDYLEKLLSTSHKKHSPDGLSLKNSIQMHYPWKTSPKWTTPKNTTTWTAPKKHYPDGLPQKTLSK